MRFPFLLRAQGIITSQEGPTCVNFFTLLQHGESAIYKPIIIITIKKLKLQPVTVCALHFYDRHNGESCRDLTISSW